MKVVVASLNYSPEPTGIAPYSAGLAAGLAARGHDVTVLTTFPHYPQWKHRDEVRWRERTVENGVRVTRLRHYVPSKPEGIRRVLSEVSFGARLVSRRLDADVVIGVSPALFASAMVNRRARLGWRGPAVGILVQDLYGPGIEEIHGRKSAQSRAVARLEERTLQTADGVSVIHSRLKDVICGRMGVPADRIAVNRNWTHVSDAPAFDRAEERRSLGWPEDKVVVLHTGAMGSKQGLETVVEAARLADAEQIPVQFVLVGDGSQRARLQQSAAGVDSITFLDPFPSEVYAATLGAADVLLVNEKAGVVETAVPSKLTSYFSSGRPVLAAADPRGTTAFEIGAAGAGVRIDPGDPKALLFAALELGGDPDRAALIGSNGPAYCSTTLAQDAILDGYDSWLHELLRASRG